MLSQAWLGQVGVAATSCSMSPKKRSKTRTIARATTARERLEELAKEGLTIAQARRKAISEGHNKGRISDLLKGMQGCFESKEAEVASGMEEATSREQLKKKKKKKKKKKLPAPATMPLSMEAAPAMNDRMLVLRENWLRQIFDGEKTLEIRHQGLQAGLSYAGTSREIRGCIELGEPIAIQSMDQWNALLPRHRWTDQQALPYSKTFGLPILRYMEWRESVPYNWKQGCVGTAKFTPVTMKRKGSDSSSEESDKQKKKKKEKKNKKDKKRKKKVSDSNSD